MLWAKVKSLVPVLENRYFLLEIFDTERCRESVLEYLVIYLKDDDSVLTKRAEIRAVGTGSCTVQYISSGVGSDAVTDRCLELLSLCMSAGNQTRG